MIFHKMLQTTLTSLIFLFPVIFGKNGQDYIMVMKSTGKSAIYLNPNGDCLVLDYDQPKDFSNEQIVLNPNVEPRVFDKLAELCEQVHTKQFSVKKLVDIMADEGKILYPGTKWCGQGNSSDHDDDFGSAIETDKCCKEHDYCEGFLDPGQCDQSMNLCNQGKYTSSHCDCDETFRQCLERAYEVENEANMVGYTFFSFLGMECFRKDHPIIKCLEWGGWAWSYCQDYLLDDRAPKLYQFFNSKKWCLLIIEASSDPFSHGTSEPLWASGHLNDLNTVLETSIRFGTVTVTISI